MAQKVSVIVTDDLDGSPDAKPVQFALGRNLFELDLTPANELKLRQALEPFIKVARTASSAYRHTMNGTGSTRPPRRRRTRMDREQSGAIRAWAKANGYSIGEKGRVPGRVVTAYNNANPGSPGRR